MKIKNKIIFNFFMFVTFIYCNVSDAAYNRELYNCTTQCGGFISICKVIVGPYMDFTFDVDSNASYLHSQFTGCDFYPALIGNDISCVVDELNSGMSSSHINLNFNVTTSRNFATQDNKSEIFFQDSVEIQNSCSHQECLALTSLKVDTSTIDCTNLTIQAVAAKIALDDSQNFVYGPREVWYWIEQPSSATVLRPVLLHEFGHALGITHITSTLDTMNPSYPAGGGYSSSVSSPLTSQYAPGPSFMEALDQLHGNITIEDMAATPFTLSAGETVISPVEWDICPGTTFPYKVAVHNRGDNYRYANISFYLSNNSNITTSDILVGSYNEFFLPHTSLQKNFNINIPQNMIENTNWYLGYIVDNLTTDINLKNNKTKMSYFKNIEISDCN